jgi:hypothetical protein
MASSPADKIVRVKKTDNRTNTHEVYLTTKREAEERMKYVAYGETFDYHPYRWFEVQRIWEVPAYKSSLTNKAMKTHLIIATSTIKTVLIGLFVTVAGGLILYYIIEQL